MPLRDRIFVERLRHAVASPALHESGNDLHVEDPARQKWRAEDIAKRVAGAEELGTALGSVDRESKGRGNECRAAAATAGPGRISADRAAEQPSRGAEQHFAPRSRMQDLQQCGT